MSEYFPANWRPRHPALCQLFKPTTPTQTRSLLGFVALDVLIKDFKTCYYAQ